MLFPIDNASRQVKGLNGIWQFKQERFLEEGFKNKWYENGLENTIEMPVPASYNDITTDRKLRDHVGWVWYERMFSVPKLWENQRIVLRFGSVTQHAVVYVNGMEVTRHKGGFMPFEVEITEKVQSGDNRVTVAVSNMLDWTCIPCGEVGIKKSDLYPEGRLEQEYWFDFFNYSGIHRPVRLYCTPKDYISDITVKTGVHGNDGLVKFEIMTYGEELPVQVTVLDEQGNVVVSAETRNGEVTIANVHLWQPGAAYLYTLRVTMGEDEYSLPFGVRTVRVTDKEFLINEKPFYFKGFGKHEDSDIRGKGLDEALNVRDFELLKWIGANSFRTSHYPYSEEIMQMADRQGIVIIDEVPAVGMNFFYDEAVFTAERVNEKTLEHHKDVLKELYERDKNHPCVVMWSVTNEPNSGEENAQTYFTEVAEYMRLLDTERPITGIMQTDVADDKISQLFDVICINRYFGWYVGTGELESIYPRMKKDLISWNQKYKKPVIVTEYGADTVAGLHKLPEVMFSEEYQIEYLQENNRAMDECDFVIGEHIWAFADFMTSAGLRRVDGNKKGIFTRNRQPKAAAFMVRRRWREEK